MAKELFYKKNLCIHCDTDARKEKFPKKIAEPVHVSHKIVIGQNAKF